MDNSQNTNANTLRKGGAGMTTSTPADTAQ